jgi:hypothetical protein
MENHWTSRKRKPGPTFRIVRRRAVLALLQQLEQESVEVQAERAWR